MNWLKWWHGTCSDSKFGLVAKKSNTNTATVIAVFAHLLEIASEYHEKIDVTSRDVTVTRGDVEYFNAELCDFQMQINDGLSQIIFENLCKIGIIENGRICNWEKRQQGQVASGSERTKKWRENKKKSQMCDENVTKSDACDDSDAIREDKIREEYINTNTPISPLSEKDSFDNVTQMPEKKQRKPKPEFCNRVNIDLPDWLSREKWDKWKLHRKSIKKPFSTDDAEEFSLKSLLKLKDAGFDPIDILEKSIANGYQGFFEPKKNQQSNFNQQKQYDPHKGKARV